MPTTIIPENGALRCFLVDVPDLVRPGSQQRFRLMGVCLEVKEETAVLDDGTACVSIHGAQQQWIQVGARPGVSLDCVVVARGGDMDLRLVQVGRVTNPHAETVRWYEILMNTNSPGRKLHQQEGGCDDVQKVVWAKGAPYECVTCETLLDLICADSADKKGCPSGVSLEDLALCLSLSTDEVLGMIQELQVSGQVYQNKDGNYLPL